VTGVRPFVVALVVLTVGSACDRSPTGLPQPPAPNSPLAGSSSSPTGGLSGSALPDESVTQLIGPAGGTICIATRCVKPKLKLHGPTSDGRSNYAVAW